MRTEEEIKAMNRQIHNAMGLPSTDVVRDYCRDADAAATLLAWIERNHDYAGSCSTVRGCSQESASFRMVDPRGRDIAVEYTGIGQTYHEARAAAICKWLSEKDASPEAEFLRVIQNWIAAAPEMYRVLQSWQDFSVEQVEHGSVCPYADNCTYGCCKDCDRIADGLEQAAHMRDEIITKVEDQRYEGITE